MMDFMLLVATNNPKDGLPSGKVLELEILDAERNPVVSFLGECAFKYLGKGEHISHVRFSRALIMPHSVRIAPESWVWDEIKVSEFDMRKILIQLWNAEFTLVDAPEEIFKIWEKEDFEPDGFMRELKRC